MSVQQVAGPADLVSTQPSNLTDHLCHSTTHVSQCMIAHFSASSLTLISISCCEPLSFVLSTLSVTSCPICCCSSALNRSPPFSTALPPMARTTSPASTPARPRRVGSSPAAAAALPPATADSRAPCRTLSFAAMESLATCKHSSQATGAHTAAPLKTDAECESTTCKRPLFIAVQPAGA